MKLRAILASCAMVLAGQASAVTYNYTASQLFNTENLGGVEDIVFNVNQSGVEVTFGHYFRFSSSSALSGVLAGAMVVPIQFGGTTYADIASLGMWLRSDDGNIDGDETLWGHDTELSSDNTLELLAAIPAGNYYLQISGMTASTAQLGGAYAAGITVLPVPEAETWAMMAAGLALMGMRLRRRTRGGRLVIG